MTRAILLLLALTPAVLPAQQQALLGSWRMSYQVGMRIENGDETPIMATGTLTIEAVGDSLIGSLATDPAPDIPARPAVRLAGKAGNGDATLVSRTKATLNINGMERESTAVSTWVLRAQGDSLEGTVQRAIEGFDGGQEPTAVRGTRRQG